MQYRSPLCGGANESLIGQTFLIKCQDISDSSPCIEESNRRIVIGKSIEGTERSSCLLALFGICILVVERIRMVACLLKVQPLLHSFQESRMRCHPVGYARLSGPVDMRIAHSPPSIINSIRPFSGALGSLSKRAISSRPMRMTPFRISPCDGLPQRWK